MKLAPRVIRDLAQIICGSHGTGNQYEWTNFIYRSGPKLTDFFRYDCDLEYCHDGSTRLEWVIGVLTKLNEDLSSNPLLPSDKIIRVIKEILASIYKLQEETHVAAVNDINKVLNQSNLGIEFDQGQYQFIDLEKKQNIDIDYFNNDNLSRGKDKFRQEFPIGLPFGLDKPSLRIFSEKGNQKFKFELKNGTGILNDNVYPNFNFRKLELACGVNEFTNDAMKKSLINMNQTELEKSFFLKYAQTFKMSQVDVPTLVPQAWIQWHSQTKKDLREKGSDHANELYRIDFVAFWNNKRYAILVDDIGHYGKKNGQNSWLANEEAYSNRLKEDRKLRKENWEVFRVSNWEIRNEEFLPEILKDLKEFMDFQ